MNDLSTAVARSLLLILSLILSGCSSSNPTASPPPSAEPEALSRTEFTDRVENYFEYEPLHAGKPSQVRIHLTDLSDGFPVEKAEVALVVKPKGSSQVTTQTVSRIGKVTGIYVAELTIPRAGDYDIEFHIKNDKLDERLPLSDFKVQ
jgi:5-hydroxyisourate hydrolase-like protein (transthyretin family)